MNGFGILCLIGLGICLLLLIWIYVDYLCSCSLSTDEYIEYHRKKMGDERFNYIIKDLKNRGIIRHDYDYYKDN